jgi:nuclear pore complex protein Nup98-Nup96
MDAHIRRLKKVPDTEFVDFDADAGVWTFKVQHFSKYGLVDSDDEDEEQQQPQDVDEAPPLRTIEDETFDGSESAEEENVDVEDEEEDMDDGIYDDEEEESEDELPREFSPPRVPYDEPKLSNRPWTATLGPDAARKVQVMQASLFKAKPQVKRGFEHAEADSVADTRDVKVSLISVLWLTTATLFRRRRPDGSTPESRVQEAGTGR